MISTPAWFYLVPHLFSLYASNRSSFGCQKVKLRLQKAPRQFPMVPDVNFNSQLVSPKTPKSGSKRRLARSWPKAVRPQWVQKEIVIARRLLAELCPKAAPSQRTQMHMSMWKWPENLEFVKVLKWKMSKAHGFFIIYVKNDLKTSNFWRLWYGNWQKHMVLVWFLLKMA